MYFILRSMVRMPLLCVLLLSVNSVYASPADIDALMRIYQEKSKDPQRLQEAVTIGREWAELCRFCHGVDGISRNDAIPNLAGQNPKYLITQFEAFASGQRHDTTMQQVARRLRESDRVDVALYFSNQSGPVNKPSSSPEQKRGEAIYQKVCQACHGEAALGQGEFPRLAGQKKDYLVNTLLSFLHKDQRRVSSSVMFKVVEQLNEEDIENLAAYLSAL